MNANRLGKICHCVSRGTRAVACAGTLLLCLPLMMSSTFAETVVPLSAALPVSATSLGPDHSVAEQGLWKAVNAVNDPELGIGIVDLGLVRRIVVNESPKADEPHIIFTMVLTSPLCPYVKELLRGIRDAIQAEMPDRRLKVVIDGKTRWTPALMTDEGKRRFAGEN